MLEHSVTAQRTDEELSGALLVAQRRRLDIDLGAPAMIEQTLQTLKDKIHLILPELVAELNPPATPTQIDEVASQLPFAFPDELRQLYGVHDGEANERGLFFGLPLVALTTALDDWQVWADLASEDFSDMDERIISVPKGHIKKIYASTHYFPFSNDGGGNNIAVDLDPNREGTKGQIINIGSDESTRYVIAPSLEDFLAFCIYQIDIGNYAIKDDEGRKYLNLKEPNNEHFLDTLSQLDLPFCASDTNLLTET